MAEKRKRQRNTSIKPWVCKEPDCGFTITMTGRNPDHVLDEMNQHRLSHQQEQAETEVIEPMLEPEPQSTPESLVASLVSSVVESNQQMAASIAALAQQTMAMHQTILDIKGRAEAEMQPQPQQPMYSGDGQPQQQYVVQAPQQPQQSSGMWDAILPKIVERLATGGGGGESSMDGFLKGVDQMAKFKEAMDRLTAPDKAREIANLNYLATLMKMANQSGIDTGPMLDQVVNSTQHQLDELKQTIQPIPQPAPERPSG